MDDDIEVRSEVIDYMVDLDCMTRLGLYSNKDVKEESPFVDSTKKISFAEKVKAVKERSEGWRNYYQEMVNFYDGYIVPSMIGSTSERSESESLDIGEIRIRCSNDLDNLVGDII